MIKRQTAVQLIAYLLFSYSLTSVAENATEGVQFMSHEWAVIGAGPAGIAVVGLLLDFGVSPHEIAWIDKEFNVGRIGKYYAHVPGNATTRAYISYIEACKTFNSFPSNTRDTLYSYDLDIEYELQIIIDPLLDITRHLKTLVKSYKDAATSLNYKDDLWQIDTSRSTIHAQKVVLATGCHPKRLDYPVTEEIPLDYAVDKAKLAQFVNPEDTVAIVGGSHSGILVAKNLCELGVSRILNFYKSPLIYSFDTGDNNVIYFNGLCGPVGRWAYNVLEKGDAPEVVRIKNSQAARNAWLPLCNKIVYAVGYERNEIPCIASINTHDSSTGKIAPNLYGIGIAYPETQQNVLGEHEQLIGLSFFMDYALKIMPDWIARRCAICPLLEKLFDIVVWQV